MITLQTDITKVPLFNIEATDNDTTLIGSHNTNLNNFSNIKYKWARSLYKTMRENFWTPEIVNLSQDSLSGLTDTEREAVDDVLGFLVFLDSLQTSNLPNLSVYISNPEIKSCLIEQTSQEELHSDSYQQIFTTLYTQEDADKVYYRFKTNPLLAERVELITGFYQDFIDTPSMYSFIRLLIANLYLEGLYFYVGFAYFYHLASNSKLVGVSSMIRLINIDEKSHIGIFVGILNELKRIGDTGLINFINEQVGLIGEITRKQEITWSVSTLESIPEFNEVEITQYIDHLINSNIKAPLGIYCDKIDNPYTHLTKIANVDKGDGNKGNFFESDSNTYSQSSAMSGFSDF